MNGKHWQDWEAMLEADPAIRAAWDGYIAQLDRDAGLIVEGVRPTGQAMTEAARRVIERAIAPISSNDNDD